MYLYLFFSGLTKPKQYDWKDSNLAMFGSDTEKDVKSKFLCYAQIIAFSYIRVVHQPFKITPALLYCHV